MYVHLENQGRPEKVGWRKARAVCGPHRLACHCFGDMDLTFDHGWDTAPASPEHTCVLPGWLLLMLHFNNCLPLPSSSLSQEPWGGSKWPSLGQMGWGVGTVASVYMLPIYHPLWPSHSTAGQLMDRSDRTQGNFPPLVLSTDLSWALFPPNEELTTYLEG